MGFLPLPKPSALMALLWPIILLPMTSPATPFPVSLNGDDKPSVYQVLDEYDLPKGLLPLGVTGYELNKETGEFSVYLSGNCKYNIDSYTLEYKSTVTGVISKGKITKLNGVKVFVILLWLNIVEVHRDGDELDFSVGITSANFPLDNFEECPECGCGFDCVKLKGASGLDSSS